MNTSLLDSGQSSPNEVGGRPAAIVAQNITRRDPCGEAIDLGAPAGLPAGTSPSDENFSQLFHASHQSCRTPSSGTGWSGRNIWRFRKSCGRLGLHRRAAPGCRTMVRNLQSIGPAGSSWIAKAVGRPSRRQSRRRFLTFSSVSSGRKWSVGELDGRKA
jgi:hypothetical protein